VGRSRIDGIVGTKAEPHSFVGDVVIGDRQGKAVTPEAITEMAMSSYIKNARTELSGRRS
jgi:hypothetical protein